MVPNEYNLQQLLPSLTAFVDSARSGPLTPATQQAYPWLEASSGLADPVPGGFYMTGSDYVKYSFPLATSMTLLAWSLLEFPGGYNVTGSLQPALAQLRWGADFLMTAHSSPTSFVVQVGNPTDYYMAGQNTGSWGKPSAMPANRTAYTITQASKGGADAVAAAAAALAATYQVFKDIDASYAQSALQHSQELYSLAIQLPTGGPSGSATYYTLSQQMCFEGLQTGGYRWKAFISNSVFDDLSLAAAWLYSATGARSYASDAEFFFQQHQLLEVPQPRGPAAFVVNYDNSAWAAALMIHHLMDFPPAKQQLVDFFRGWMTGRDTANNPVLFVTPRGLHYLGEEPLPNAATAATLALLYAHHPKTSQSSYVTTNMDCFALQQVTYALGGQMGKGRSFIVGVGNSYPREPQHQQASCASSQEAAGQRVSHTCDVDSALLQPAANPHIITGALVAGPDGKDGYVDDRRSPQSRVGALFNIPMMAAVAGLLQHNVRPPQCQREQGLFQATLLRFTPS